MEKFEAEKEEKITKPIANSDSPMRTILGVAIAAIVLGTLTGYILSTKSSGTKAPSPAGGRVLNAQRDTRTFKDFAEGTLKAKPQPTNPAEYTEGTHLLIRDGAVPVALTSSMVELAKYEGKKVRVFGETQKALKEGWLMDIGRVEEIK